MVSEAARGISSRTYNEALSTMKSVFKKLRRKAGMVENPFDETVTREEETLHRIPFSPTELKSILDTAKSDAFSYPLIVTGVCTAMRRGDVCLLRWKDVDLTNRFITVKTSKTDANVQIPIFPMLYDVLSGLPQESEFCFPEAAAMYMKNPDGINHRMKKVFIAAGFVDDDDEENGNDKKIAPRPISLPTVPETEMHDRGMTALDALTGKQYTAKVRESMKQVFDLYLKGGTVDTIAKELKMGKGSASLYLNRIEKAVGFTVVRRRRKAVVKVKCGVTHGKRTGGLRRVNQRGFHAFRATWVTLALTAGVAIELVRRVTGHATVEVVLGNYFQPGREDFRNALQNAMPALLTAGGAPSRDDQIHEILRNSTARTWKQDHVKVLAMLEPKCV
jgi:integrase